MTDKLEVYGIILTFMAKLHADLVPEERNIIERFFVEQRAKQCATEICDRFVVIKNDS